MPLYEFECTDCGVFERAVPIAERHDVRCACGSLAKLLISRTSFLLIGGGWSGRSHPVIHPPETDHSLDHRVKTNYVGFTEEEIEQHKRMEE